MTTVAVVCSVFNEEKHVGAFLDSLAAQSYRDFDLVIVDDGSTDATGDVVRSYGEKLGLRLLELEHQGWKHAKAAAIREAQADILIIFDADEVIEPDCIRQLVAPFEDPEVGAVGGRIVSKGDTWTVAGADLLRVLMHRLRKTGRQQEAWVIAAGCMALRASALRQVGGLSTTDRLIGQDVDISWRLREHGWKLLSVDDAVAAHRDPPTVGGLFKRQYTFGRKAVYTYWLHKKALLSWKSWVRFYPLALVVLLFLHPTLAAVLLLTTLPAFFWLIRKANASGMQKLKAWAVLTIHSAAFSLGFVVEVFHSVALGLRGWVSPRKA